MQRRSHPLLSVPFVLALVAFTAAPASAQVTRAAMPDASVRAQLGGGFDETWFRATQAMVAVTRCYPGKGKGGHGDRVPSREEQALCRPWLEQELTLIQPRLIIPIGKLALGLFFDPVPALEDVIGTRHVIDGRIIIPLPHPSGASTWPNKPENAARIKRAIAQIAAERELLFGH